MSAVIELGFMPVIACPLCGSGNGQEYDSSLDTLFPEINRFLPVSHQRLPSGLVNHRRCCGNCGLIYLSPRLNAESLGKVYALWYGYAYRRVMSDPSHVAERRREFEDNHLHILETHHPRRGRLLDVGCGSGLFLGLAKRRGWKVSGIELDPATAAWGRKHEGIEDIRCGTLAGALAGDERFDVITMFDYLEHSDRPQDDLDHLVDRLAPDGALMVRVPNAKGWQARYMGKDWLAIMPTHLSYFTPEVLCAALESRGLVVEYLGARNYRSEYEILKQRIRWLYCRLAGANGGGSGVSSADFEQPNVGPKKAALRRWLYSLWIEQIDHIGGWFNAGNNLTVIARKSL